LQFAFFNWQFLLNTSELSLHVWINSPKLTQHGGSCGLNKKSCGFCTVEGLTIPFTHPFYQPAKPNEPNIKFQTLR